MRRCHHVDRDYQPCPREVQRGGDIYCVEHLPGPLTTGAQIPPASKLATKLGDVRISMLAIATEAKRANLAADAELIEGLARVVGAIATVLEARARDAWARARGGTL